MKHLNTLLIVLFIFSISFTSTAQNGQIEFTKVDHEKGLSNNYVNCIVQDSKGYIWAGTNEGLNRFNGYEAKVYLNEPGNYKSLADNKINALCIDTDHNLWIGTEFNGLCRYDSVEDAFINFQPNPNDIHTISSKYITALAADANNIWIGTYYGLNRYNKKTKQFEQIISSQSYQITDEIINNSSKIGIQADLSQLLKKIINQTFVGEANLLNSISKQLKRSLTESESEFLFNYCKKFLSVENLDRNEIKTIWLAEDGKIWTGFEKAGIGVYDPEKKTWEYFRNPLNPNQNMKANQTRPICMIGHTLWISTMSNGVYQFDTQTKKFSAWGNYPTTNVYACSKDKQGNALIGAGNDFLIVPANQKPIVYPANTYNPTDKSVYYITAIMQDQSGSYWIGTQGGGMFYTINTKAFNTYTTDSKSHLQIRKSSVSSICITKDKSLWVGYFENDADCFNLKNGQREIYKNDRSPSSIGFGSVLKIFADDKNNVWFGSYNAELKRFDSRTKKFVNYHSLPDSIFDIRGVAKDKYGNIWAASHGKGLIQFDESGNFKAIYKSNLDWKKHLSIDWTTDACIDRTNYLWVATVCGISKTKTDKLAFESYRNISGDNTSLSHNQVRSVFADSKNRVWVGTLNGLNLYNRKKNNFIRYSYAEGLNNLCINAISEDKNGNLWVSTNKGISKIKLVDSISNQITVQNYTEADGILAGEYSQNAVARSEEGRFYFGCKNGITSFHPDSIIENKIIPQVHITDIKIFTKSILTDSTNFSFLKKEWMEKHQITLEYNQNMIWIDYVALNYIQPEKNQYCYKLEGFDNEWRFVQNNRRATYTNLAPGKYTFRVRACNNDGVWNDVGAELKIVVHPPFWKSALGRMILIAMICLSLFFTYYILKSRDRLERRIELEKMESLNQLQINHAKNEFFTNITHEFRTPITLILGPLQKIMNTPDEQIDVKKFKLQIGLISRNAQRLLNLINQILDLKKLEAGKLELRPNKDDIILFTKNIASSFTAMAYDKKIQFQVSSSMGELKMPFDPDKYEKIVMNLLANAFKFTPNHGIISLMMSYLDEQKGSMPNFKLEISDNGIGLAKEHQNKIFELYYQVKDNNTSGNPGTGVGLFMVKQLVELHGGSIDVESEPTQGCKFTILLPIRTGEEETEKSSTINTELIDLQFEEENSFRKNVPETARLKVLVVDDNEDIRIFIRSELEDFFEVIDAPNGKEGLKIAEELSPDIVLSDVMMPEMSGYEFCESLKKNVNTSHLPVILLTAKSSDEAQLEGYHAGADDYMTKPFNTEILRIKLNKLLETKRNNQKQLVEKPNLVPEQINKTNPVETQFLKDLVNAIYKHMDNSDLDVTYLARELSLSRTVLYEKIQNATGQSVADYIRTFRLDHACKLLQERNLNISEVAYRVGYKSLAHFTRSFKKQYEVTPSDFIQRMEGRK